MNKKQYVSLLNIIETNGNVNKLRRQKLSFKQIAQLIDDAISWEYLSVKDDRISLTTIGKEFLKENESLLKIKNKKDWIEPDFKSRITPIDKNDVFLPNQNELSFLKKLL
jgi:hypothetical protein